MTPKQITRKDPFKRILPYTQPPTFISGNAKSEVSLPENQWMVIPQEAFLSELHPSGHDINYKAPKVLKDKDGNVKDSQDVSKIAVAMQEVISIKQRIHLASNPTKFTLTEKDRTQDSEDLFVVLKQAWADKNMDVYKSKVIESWLDTADGALYVYLDSGKVGCREFSFKNGDVLLPHYDYFGNLSTFGRMYGGVDDAGRNVEMLDVFDKTNITTFQKKRFMGMEITEKWRVVQNPKPHGFKEIPIVYKRSDDVCWGSVQPLIDKLEESLSNLSENNRYYANSILFISGDVTKMPSRDGAGKVLQGKGDAKASFLATPESSASQTSEIDLLLSQIFLGSFTVSVSPDSVKSSGDLPGITVKLLFSPAIERALASAKEWDDSIDKLARLFKWGYGMEIGKQTQMSALKVRAELDIWMPQNQAEIADILNQGIYSKAISRQTANETFPYAVNGEKERVDKEIQEDKDAEMASSLNIT